MTSDGVYEDLLFVDWDAVGSCFFSALFLRDGGAFSIQFLPAAKKASKVSVTEPFGTGTLTLVVSSESSTCPAPVSGSGVTLTATCAGITSIGLSGTSETLLDNLTITYEPIFDPPTECSTKGKKPHKAKHSEKSEKSAKSEKSEKSEKSAKSEKSEKSEKSAKSEKSEKSEKSGKSGKSC